MKTRIFGMALAITCFSVAFTLNAAPAEEEELASQDIIDLFDGAKAYNQTAALVDIGKRVAGGPLEQLAAARVMGEMESLGLDVEMHEFPFYYFEDLGSSLVVQGDTELGEVTMYYSREGDVEAELVFCELGEAGDFAEVDVVGKIALIRRGVIPYSVKAANATAAGAIGMIVFNSAPEIMYATLGAMVDIPCVSLSGDEGEALVLALEEGPVTAHLVVECVYYPSTSQNIIGTLEGTQPDQGIVYMGAHYDSVWFGPGANDNASGLGCLLEAARVLTTRGHKTKATIKFIAFGAEEAGLEGSYVYVDEFNEEVTSQGLGMVNMDMVGVGDTLLLGHIGWLPLSDPSLAEYTQDKAEKMEIESWAAAEMSPNSDHAYFEVAGVPVVRLEQSPDPWYHSAEDSMDKIDPAILEQNGELATAVVYDWAKNPNWRAKKEAKELLKAPENLSFQSE